jgi:HSP20 family molecular chaperone IbpA
MFFTTAQPQFYRPLSTPSGRTLERFLSEAMQNNKQPAAHYTQDESAFALLLDLPGIAKDQLTISIEGPVVRLQTKEGVARKYRAAYEFPQDIDATLSEAKLENGVLTLKLAKKVPVSTATELNIL